MKVQGREIITMVFDRLIQQGYRLSALRVADAIIHDKNHIILCIGDIDWNIEQSFKMFNCDDLIKSIPSSTMCTAFHINKEYEIEESHYNAVKKLIYED